MRHGCLLALAILSILGNSAQAQNAPWQFRWQKGQVLTYRAEHQTAVFEVAEGNKLESVAKLNLVKRWQVADIDAKGVATLYLVLAGMRNEQKRPNGEVLLFDSANLDKSTPEMREQMGKFIGQTLAILRMDGQGRIIEVKQGSPSRYEAEHPFLVVFPNIAPAEGQTWLRPFSVTLDPPHGTGEKYEATQRFQCAKIAGGKATLAVTTQFKALPEAAKDQVPLLQKLGEGQLVFDLQNGRMQSVQLNIDRTLQNHLGDGTSYRFQSRYVEELIEAK